MKIAYYGFYDLQSPSGAGIHVYQSVTNLIAGGHELYTWIPIPGAELLPTNPVRKACTLRDIDALYVRLDSEINSGCRFSRGWRRHLFKPGTLHVWELNTLPESRRAYGKSKDEVKHLEDELRAYAPYCDLLVCVSEKMESVAREQYGFSSTLFVPNGSDPERFYYDPAKWDAVPPYKVAWIGSFMEPWHDFQLVKNAAAKCLAIGLPVEFHLAGSGMPDGSLPANMTVHGRIDYDKLPDFLAPMHIGLISYKPEFSQGNSPLKMFDYLSSGLIVLSAPQDQYERIVMPCLPAYAQPFHSSDNLVDLMSQFTKEANPQAITDRLACLARSDYSWKIGTQKLSRTLEALHLQQ